MYTIAGSTSSGTGTSGSNDGISNCAINGTIISIRSNDGTINCLSAGIITDTSPTRKRPASCPPTRGHRGASS